MFFLVGGRGVTIVQQIKPLRKSIYTIIVTQSTVTIVTLNIRRIAIKESTNEPIRWRSKNEVTIDGISLDLEQLGKHL